MAMQNSNGSPSMGLLHTGGVSINCQFRLSTHHISETKADRAITMER